MTEKMQLGRIAFRVEGNMWNAYYAPPDTMKGALFIGSVHMHIVEDEERKAEFMALMRAGLSKILEGLVGVELSWPGPVPAPEHERSKE